MKEIMENGGVLALGKRYIFNNLWGADTGAGSQSVWGLERPDSQVSWGTRWDWRGREDTIKSYAAIVTGWHWGWRIAGTGLPLRVNAIRHARTSWEFDLLQDSAGGYNVTYDMWLSDNPRIQNENPSGEIMIWLNYSGVIQPIGARKADFAIGGTSWVLWEGPHPISGWPVYSFVRGESADRVSLDLADFFAALASLGLDGIEYLISVQAGIEVFTGKGRLETKSYSIDIE